MCGIFGYIGKRTDAGTIVIDGIKNLEYRGYDSWGIAQRQGNLIIVEKNTGKISDVDTARFHQECSAAIAHTRWATHGGVTQLNAHPHTSSDMHIAVVHNGIIENNELLRKNLQEKGHIFLSDTDTEVIPHLIEEEQKISSDFASAFQRACKKLEGRYAILAMNTKSGSLVAARKGSPLIVGVAKDQGYFIASDIPAFLNYTRTVHYLDDGEMLVTDGSSILFADLESGKEHPKRHIKITRTVEETQKGDFDHFMLKEIMEQKETIARAVNQNEEQIRTIADAIKNAQGTFLAACGTAHKACMAAEYFFSVIVQHHVNVASAGEFKLFHHFLKPESLLIVVSQSGETADVLEAMHIAKLKGAKVLAIVNNEGSTIDREADFTLSINAGPERAVASTKALTGQMAVLMLIAYTLAGKLHEGKTLLLETGSMINDMLNPRYLERIKALAQTLKEEEDCYIIGKSWNFPMALESAIKIQEVSHIHAEGFAAAELKHGPIALIEENTPCLVLVGNDEVTVDIINNAIELKARGAKIIGVGPARHAVFDEWLKVPDVGPAQAICNIIPIQILAYYLAVERGKNPDLPRNLAKSVTVK